MNVVSDYKRKCIEELIKKDVGQREIARRLLVDRITVRRIAKQIAKPPTPSTGSESEEVQNLPPLSTGSEGDDVQNHPSCPPAPATGSMLMESLCTPHRAWIEAQVNLGRNAMAIYQDLVEMHGFTPKYCSVRRFIKGLKHRDPERFDVLEYGPGEEAQVDYGEGAPVSLENGKKKNPYLFVMTLKYSGKSFRKVVMNTSQETWARLHEEAFRSFGGCPRFVVLDNLKEGVVRPDLYEPELNRVYAAMLNHYGVTAQPCRVRDPNRKGTVERAIQHTQDTALKGRTFKTIDEQNTWLAAWEERWAAPRIHGSKKRQVMAMYLEEKPHLLPLPAAGFRFFVEETRTVDGTGMIQMKGSYYSAPSACLYMTVRVRVYPDEIVILDLKGDAIRRHPRTSIKGRAVIAKDDRIFNPSRETGRLLERIHKIGPHAAQFAQELFQRSGRASQGIIYGLAGLTRTYAKEDIDRACARVMTMTHPSYRSIKAILTHTAPVKEEPVIRLQQQAPEIRPVQDYQRFWDLHAQSNQEGEEPHGHVHH